MEEFSDEEQALLQKYKRLIGYIPIGLRDTLQVLAHPDVIDLTRAFLDSKEM